jgi:hypothetical protein
MNECIPKYEPGADLTGHVNQAGGVTGKRVLALKGDKRGVEAVSDDTTGGNVVVGYPARGGRHFGVSGYDAADTAEVKIVRGNGKVVPITASGALAYDAEVMSTADGRVETLDTGAVAGARAIGRTIRSAANGADALVELY